MKALRVHIIGGTGSGKTFLAGQYSKINNIPVYGLDDMVWVNGAASNQRSIEQRYKLLQSAVDSNKWVIEGVFYKWLSPSFQRADKIIVLNVPKGLRLYRVIKRTLKLLVNKPNNFQSIISNCLKIIQYNHHYDRLNYVETINMLSTFKSKVVICNNYQAACDELGIKFG